MNLNQDFQKALKKNPKKILKKIFSNPFSEFSKKMNKLDKIIILDQQVDHNIGIIETTSQIYQNILFSMAFCNKGHSKWWYEYKKLKIYEV